MNSFFEDKKAQCHLQKLSKDEKNAISPSLGPPPLPPPNFYSLTRSCLTPLTILRMRVGEFCTQTGGVETVGATAESKKVLEAGSFFHSSQGSNPSLTARSVICARRRITWRRKRWRTRGEGMVGSLSLVQGSLQ